MACIAATLDRFHRSCGFCESSVNGSARWWKRPDRNNFIHKRYRTGDPRRSPSFKVPCAGQWVLWLCWYAGRVVSLCHEATLFLAWVKANSNQDRLTRCWRSNQSQRLWLARHLLDSSCFPPCNMLWIGCFLLSAAPFRLSENVDPGIYHVV